jgi:cytoskeletal protein CcmA (bactofilin family)
MKTLCVSILIVAFLSGSLTGLQLFTRPDTYVIGGDYVVHRGEAVTGDLRTMFAQVTLEDGARIEGKILSVSSVLELAGTVRGEIVGIGSEIVVRNSAKLVSAPQHMETIRYVVLLPQIARTERVIALR